MKYLQTNIDFTNLACHVCGQAWILCYSKVCMWVWQRCYIPILTLMTWNRTNYVVMYVYDSVGYMVVVCLSFLVQLCIYIIKHSMTSFLIIRPSRFYTFSFYQFKLLTFLSFNLNYLLNVRRSCLHMRPLVSILHWSIVNITISYSVWD